MFLYTIAYDGEGVQTCEDFAKSQEATNTKYSITTAFFKRRLRDAGEKRVKGGMDVMRGSDISNY